MKILPGGRKSKSPGLSRKNSRWTRVQTSRPSVSMLTLVTPRVAAGRYSLTSTPMEPAILPPAALMRATSSCGTDEDPCMTSGKPGRRALIFSRTSKWRDCLPLNLKAPWLVPMAQARESQPVCLTKSSASKGSVRHALPSSTLMSSSTPPSMPSSASTEMPLACARSTTRLVIATFWSNGSCDASIMTELKKPESMHS